MTDKKTSNGLEDARSIINGCDSEMARLFEKRMEAAKEVALYKREHGLPVFDAAREKEVIRRNSELVKDPGVRSYYVRFLQNTMDLSKAYQHRLLEGMRVAYGGVEGAFAHIAAKSVFPDAVTVSYPDFASAYSAAENGECDAAVLPVENSFAGEVGQVSDLMFKGSLFVNGTYELRITQNLLGTNGSDITKIKKVISHPQALMQCAEYLKEHGFETEEAENTAVAAKLVAEKGDPSLGAIASKETAELYGLTLLDHDINESASNTTRFAVLSRAKNADKAENSTFMLMFTVKHKAGALAEAIGVIGKHGFNMKALRSRPMRGLPWEYYFYVEAEGDRDSENAKAMLSELEKHCEMLKVVGQVNSK